MKEIKDIPVVVAYARYSSTNQREESIDAQLRAINSYAKNLGYEISDDYVDEAKTARYDNRPCFQKLISDAKEHKFDIVIVHKFDRFARNVLDSAFYKKTLRDIGIKVLSVIERIDDTPEGRLLECFLDAFSEFSSENLAREVLKGLYENAYKALHTGGKPPYGYDVLQDKTLAVNKHRAEAIKKIFEMVANSASSGEICRWLKDNNFYTQFGNEFSKSAIGSIIANPKYKGIYVYNQFTRKKIDGVYKDLRNDDKEIIRLPNLIPRIVDDELWEKANQMFSVRKRGVAYAKDERIYLLSGVLYCGKCESHFCGEHTNARGTHSERTIYVCKGKKVKNTCKVKAVLKEELEEYVLGKLEELINEQYIDGISEEIFQGLEKFISAIPSNERSLTGELMIIQNKIEKTLDVMLEIGASDSIKDRLKKYEDDKKILEFKLKEAKNNNKNILLPTKEDIKIDLLKTLDFKTKTPTEQRRIVCAFVKKIVLNEKDTEESKKRGATLEERFDIIINFSNAKEGDNKLLKTIM